MTLGSLQHVNIRCADLEKARLFYVGIGLQEGDRPPFASTGHWLYAKGMPIIHLVQAAPAERADGAGTGAIDHIALAADGLDEMRSTLARRGIAYEEMRVPRDNIVQILVRDPDGVRIELNYPEA